MWDYRLVKALRTHEDLVTGTGVPIYWDRSDRVAFEAHSFVSKSKAALERAEEKASKGTTKNYGKTFYAVPKTTDGGPLPTLEEFVEEQRLRREMSAGKIKVTGDKFSNAAWTPAE